MTRKTSNSAVIEDDKTEEVDSKEPEKIDPWARVRLVYDAGSKPPIWVSRKEGPILVGYHDDPSALPEDPTTAVHRIHPGINMRVPAKVWEVIRYKPGLKVIIEQHMRLIANPNELDIDAVPPILKRSSSRAAINWWKSVEKRNDVKTMIEDKLESMDRFRHVGDGADL